MIREGRFREDLYYRLNVIEIAVPPLAARPADVLPLARHFLGASMQLSDDATLALLAHDWPGNVRELRNAIERAKLLAQAQMVTAASLNLPAPAARGCGNGAPARLCAAAGSTATPMNPVGRRSRRACARRGGNVSRAAQTLGLSRQALYRRMQRFNLRGSGDA